MNYQKLTGPVFPVQFNQFNEKDALHQNDCPEIANWNCVAETVNNNSVWSHLGLLFKKLNDFCNEKIMSEHTRQQINFISDLFNQMC